MSVRLEAIRWLRQLRGGKVDSAPPAIRHARRRHRSDARRRLALRPVRSAPLRSSRPRGLWIGPDSDPTPDPAEGRCVLYFHGGGYVMGSPSTHLPVADRFARALESPVLVARYRKAPRHPFPAAVEDGVRAYADLVDRGWPAGGIVVAGESAGGGLAISTVLSAIARSMLPPAGLVLIAPWTRLDTGRQRPEPVRAAPTPGTLSQWAASYLAGCAPEDPLASPGLANLTRLPPSLIVVGEDDGLLADSRELAGRLSEFDRRVELMTIPRAFHGFHHYSCPETAAVFDAVRRFGRAVT